ALAPSGTAGTTTDDYTAAPNTGPARGATLTYTTTSQSGSTEGQLTQTVTVAQAAGPGAATATMGATSATQGGQATVTGSGFLPGEDVTATMYSDPVVIGTKPADPSGNVTFTWTVPSSTPAGDHTVELVGADSGTTASAPLTVQAAPTVQLTRQDALLRGDWAAWATNYAPHETVSFFLTNDQGTESRGLGSAPADNQGRVGYLFTVPADIPSGSYLVWAHGASSDLWASAPLQIAATWSYGCAPAVYADVYSSGYGLKPVTSITIPSTGQAVFWTVNRLIVVPRPGLDPWVAPMPVEFDDSNRYKWIYVPADSWGPMVDAETGCSGSWSPALYSTANTGSNRSLTLHFGSGGPALTIYQLGTGGTATMASAAVTAGGVASVTGSGFLPGESVTATMYSDPVVIGTQTADADGNVAFTWAVPSDTAPGDHTVGLVGASSGASATAAFVVAAADPTAKQITRFTVNGVDGVIDQTNHTIIVTLPAGSDLSALAPQIAFDGASVSPASGETRDFSGIGISAVLYYTVTAEDGSTQKYDVVVGSDGPRISVMRALDGSSYNVHPGDPVTVTFVVANWGLGAADDLVVSAPLPAGLNPGDVTATATNGTYDPATGMWHIDHIDPASLVDAAGYTLTSGTRMLTLAFTVPSDAKTGDDLTFAAELTSIGGQTPPPSMVIVGSTVPIHYLVTAPGEGWLRPSVAGGTFPLGTPQLTYTLGLYNIGTGPVTGVQAVHHIPDGFTLVSAVPNLGTYDPASGVWTIDDTIDPAHTAQLVVTLTPDPDLTTGTVPVTVQVTRIDGADVPSDLSATGNLVFQEPISIVLTADADKATAGPGEQVTHTIAVTSTNTYSLWSLQVNVTLPEHATLVSSSADGSFDPATGKWVTSWVALQTGGGMTKPTLTLTYTVDSDAPDGAALTTTARIDPIPEVGVADPITASATTTVTGGITAPTDLSGATVGVMGPQVYTGMPLTPPVTVTLGGVSLVEGTDFTVAFSNNTNAGTASVTVTGIGAYAGTASGSFTIGPRVITFTIDPINDQAWTGSPVTPTIVVHDGTKLLVAGTDYTVSYETNTDAGTATVTVSGVGNYEGSGAQVTFTITAPPVEPKPQTLTFDQSSAAKIIGDAPFTNTLAHVGDGTVTFASSDETVAVVDASGLVTIVGVGEATITATAAAVPGEWLEATASYTLTVSPKDLSSATVGVQG
ncbi:MAG: DUF11 domain-containing protein, partial [Actinomycetia bacterium]|nr:DUF11 domain-containing protein [Actinomycetes bacterium]